MMRVIATLASSIEDMSNDDGILANIINNLVESTLADKLWPPFKTIVYSPVLTAVVTLIIYIIFSILFLPLYLISFIVTSYGSLALVVISVFLGARAVARTIAFPGSAVSIQREMSVDFLRRLSMHLEQVANMTANMTATLMLVASGRIPRNETAMLGKRLDDMLASFEVLPRLAAWLQGALDGVSDQRYKATPRDTELVSQLKRAVELLAHCSKDMSPIAKSVMAEGNNSAYINAGMRSSELIMIAGRSLQASESLKAAAVAIRPASSADDNFMSKVKMVLHANKGPEGAETLSFSIMREQVRSKFGAERFLINGADGNIIDGVYIPSQERHASPLYDPHAVSSVGTVMFCSPNAGLYELLAQANKDCSWAGFYTKLGFDVCLFNYRGYNCSTGVPAPDRVKSDGCTVARYLRQTRGVKHLVIHGESIGGMVACHVARTCGADLLVCDRTFASLDSVASRLLGWWAGLGLRFLGLWNTDVVSDFLSCSCPKVVLQDPADEIIADESSLKNGVATHLVLGDSLWPLRTLPRIYALAEVLNEPVPGSEEGLALLSAAESVSAPLPVELITHFCACVLDIFKRATRSAKERRSNKRGGGGGRGGASAAGGRGRGSGGGNSQSERSDVSTGLDSQTPNGNVKKPGYGGNNGNSNGNSQGASPAAGSGGSNSQGASLPCPNHGSSSSASGAATGGNNGGVGAGIVLVDGSSSHTLELDHDEENDTEHVYPYGDGDDDYLEDPFDEEAGATGRSADVEDWTMFENENGLNADDNDVEMSAGGGSGDRSKVYSNYNGSGRSLDESAVEPIERVWLSLSRTHGGTGNLLGQAAVRRMDGVLCWVCAAIVWASRATEDFSVPDAAKTITETSADLSRLIDGIFQRELGNDHAVIFVRRALILIAKRSKECSLGSSTGLASTAEVAARTGKGAVDVVLRNLRKFPSSLAGLLLHRTTPSSPSSSSSGAASSHHHHNPLLLSTTTTGTTGDVQTEDLASLVASYRVAPLSGSDIGVGNLVPLHTGHNGWPSDNEISMVRMLLDKHGFSTIEFVSNNNSNNHTRGHRGNHNHNGRR